LRQSGNQKACVSFGLTHSNVHPVRCATPVTPLQLLIMNSL
jgi:hypothetical protein